MTTITPGSEQRAATQDAEHAARVRKAHDSAISRAEGWRRRGPLLPALIFMIVVNPNPVPVYPVLLNPVLEPGPARFRAGSSDCRTT